MTQSTVRSINQIPVLLVRASLYQLSYAPSVDFIEYLLRHDFSQVFWRGQGESGTAEHFPCGNREAPMTDHTQTLWRYEWLQKGWSDKTIRTYQHQLASFGTWLSKPLQSASHADCAMFIMTRMVDVGPNAAHHSWRAMSSYYTFVSRLDEGETPNPMAKVKCPKVPEPATKGVTTEEVKLLLSACAGHDVESVRDRAIINIFACTGLRKSEVVGLAMDDVNIEQRLLLVRKSKTGKPRVVPMSTDATVALVRYLRLRARNRHAEGCTALWLGTKGSLGNTGVHLMMSRRSEQVGIKVTAHQFRREFAVLWLSAGGSQVSLMAICGWSSSAMPARYTRFAAERLAADEYRRMYK